MTCPFQFYNAASNHCDVIDWLVENYKFHFVVTNKNKDAKAITNWICNQFDDPIFSFDCNEDGYYRVVNHNARWEVFDGVVYIRDLDDALIFRLKMGL